MKYVAVAADGQQYDFTADDDTAARHWVINHLDLSRDWRIVVHTSAAQISLARRTQLAQYSVQQIMDADDDLLMGATEDFDGMLVPIPTNATSLVALLTDSQVETILGYLT